MFVGTQPSMLDTYQEFSTGKSKHILNEHKVMEFQTWANNHLGQAAQEINDHDRTIRDLQATMLQMGRDMAKMQVEIDNYFKFVREQYPEVQQAYAATKLVNQKFDSIGKEDEWIAPQTSA